MRRRDFIGVIGSAISWAATARAQPSLPVVGFLSSRSPVESELDLAGFRKGLSESGYVEHQNVAIEYRWAENQYDRLPALAAELVKRQVRVIAAVGGPTTALAVKAATKTIPFVFTTGVDPVKLGLVDSFAKPGGNATGVNMFITAVEAKRLALLRLVVLPQLQQHQLAHCVGEIHRIERAALRFAPARRVERESGRRSSEVYDEEGEDHEHHETQVRIRQVGRGESRPVQREPDALVDEARQREHEVFHEQTEGERHQRDIQVAQADAQESDERAHGGGDETTHDCRREHRPVRSRGAAADRSGVHGSRPAVASATRLLPGDCHACLRAHLDSIDTSAFPCSFCSPGFELSVAESTGRPPDRPEFTLPIQPGSSPVRPLAS